MKKAIIIILLVLVVLGGTFAGLWFFTDIFNFLKPTSDNFSEQLNKLLGTEKNLSYSEYEQDLNKLKLGDSYTAEYTVKANVSVPSNIMDYSTQRTLNNSSFNVKTAHNSDATSLDITVLKDNKDVIKAQAISDGKKLSVNSSDLYNKYLTFDESSYEKYCKLNNIQVDEDTKSSIKALTALHSNNSSNIAYDLSYISKEDFESLQKNYKNIFTDLIDEDKYSTKKNQEITVGDDDVKATAYSVTLTGKDAYDMSKKMLEKMKDDETLKSLILQKYDILKQFSNVNSEEMPELSNDKLNDLFANALENLEDSKDDLTKMKGAFKATIYSNKKNEPVKFQIEKLKSEDDDEGSVIFTEDLEDGKTTYILNMSKLSELSNSDEDDSSYNASYKSSSRSLNNVLSSINQLKIVDNYSKDDESRNGTLTFYVKAEGSKEQELMEVKYDIINTKSELKVNVSATSTALRNATLNYEYSFTGLDTDTKNFTYKLSGKLAMYNINVDVNGTIKDGASIETLSDSNSVDLTKVNDEEFKKIQGEVVTNAANNLPNKFSTFGIKVTKDDILALAPKQEAPTTEQNTPAENNSTEALPAA